jgi:nitroreductase
VNAVDTLLARRSAPVLDLPIPVLDLEKICQSALSAPDHRNLRPWRYIMVGPEHKSQLVELYVRAKQLDGEMLKQDAIDKLAKKVERAPHIVICVMTPVEHPSVPLSEQMLSAGAGVQNMIICAHLLGCGAYWRTGGLAYSAGVKELLGLAIADEIVGFLYLGKSSVERKVTVNRPDTREFFTDLGRI